MNSRKLAIRHAGTRLLDATAPASPELTEQLIDQMADLARAAVEEAVTELRVAHQNHDEDRIARAIRTLERVSSPVAEEPTQEELLNAGRRNAILAGYGGLNNLERGVAFLAARSAEFASRPWSEQVFLAGQFCHSGRLPEECR